MSQNQSIQVFVRCRPPSSQEKRLIVEVTPQKHEVKVNESKTTEAKSFFFDQVFGPEARQIDVYKTVVRPLIDQVLLGFNCTVFAYGQTGTGKTYTMEGDTLDLESSTNGDDLECGIIPRSISQLLDSIKEHDNKFTVRVSFIELYNEEAYDLLSPSNDITKLKMSVDANKKGSVIVENLEEMVVQTKEGMLDILKRGSAKRQTAATLLNACSSRSHTIFSVTVHIKEGSVEDEELLKIGKLNLVDLAGSENIGRSGAQDKRAREAGNINQSLLTLGRVITALVEKRPHIPYRESKLTRLLQDSLGGKTKTSIIATISPALSDVHETLNTLDFATRAKNNTNKPEMNQKVAKTNLLTLAYKLRTLLRLPKAHKWIWYEWFYPNIDKTLLAGENDFCICLKESFPNLTTRMLTKTEWCKVRRLMGKPRRCSQAFLAEERALLYNKRQKIRQLQQQKVVDVNYFRDLPMQIPLSLVIGTRVTALLHHPHNDLYTGIIDAVDTASHGYRITFDRPGVGTHTVPDYEVLSIDPPEFLPLNSFQTRIKPRMPLLKSPKFLELLGYQVAEALNGSKIDTMMNNHGYMLAGTDELSTTQYPIKLLALMVRVSKILSLKKKRVYELKSMNDEVERLHSLDQEIPQELKKSYASILLDLDKLNNDLDDHLKAVQIFSNELSIDTNCIPDPNLIKQQCCAKAKEIIDSMLPDYEISNETSIAMITHMTTILFHLKSLSENDDSALKLKALNDTMLEYKSTLNPIHMSNYEDNIEIHVNYLINRNED